MVVNDLAGPVTNTSGPKPQIFWEVYSAFDEGEYYHGNNRDEDPVEIALTVSALPAFILTKRVRAWAGSPRNKRIAEFYVCYATLHHRVVLRRRMGS